MSAPAPRHARAPRRSTMPPESVALGRMLAVLGVALCVLIGGVIGAAFARAASDAPTPYSVTAAGLTFPAPLPAHGHVNVRTADGVTHGLHLDPNPGHPGRPWIGATFVPWAAFGISDGCVVWVQVSQYDEHYGEGGQPPVCLTTKEPTPCPTTTPPTPSPEPTSSPTPTASPEPTATPTSAPSPPTDPTPQPSTSTSAPSPSPTSTSAAPSASPSPTPTSTVTLAPPPTTSPTTATSAAPTPGPTAFSVAPPRTPSDSPTPPPTAGPELAATGVDAGLVFILGVCALLGGVIAWGIARRGGVR
ncbi:MAG: hypothetical protein NVV66_18465 [Cellulomonas sp.]|uniref:hypothetical protein n=1 Tax=Cellulomonas sp. TaxID=40001 RepID=UPI002588D544|nr:hypothetical protein [Cellulomonas sp.]MCR6706582.1 hypothetical protein [Cellulomonas sp.]